MFSKRKIQNKKVRTLSFEISCQKSSANSILYQRQSANSVFHLAF